MQGSQEYPTGYHRVFSVEAGITVELWGMTITGGGVLPIGDEDEYGAGILNEGRLLLEGSNVIGNSEIYSGGPPGGVFGVGIYSTGSLTLENSTVSENECYGGDGGGGGIYSTGSLMLENSTVSENQCYSGPGGGIYNAGVALVANSVVSNNTGGYQPYWGGGGIHNTGDLTVVNTKIEGNFGGIGGGICNIGGAVTVRKSTVSNNGGDAYDDYGDGIHSEGTMFLESTTVSSNGGLAGQLSSYGTATLVNDTVSGPYHAIMGSGTMRLISSSVVATFSGGPIRPGIDFSGDLYVRNSLIVDGDPDDGVDVCASPVISEGYNIESPGDTCGLSARAVP